MCELWMLRLRVGSIAGPMVEVYCLFIAMEGDAFRTEPLVSCCAHRVAGSCLWLGHEDFLSGFDAELVPLGEMRELPWSHG